MLRKVAFVLSVLLLFTLFLTSCKSETPAPSNSPSPSASQSPSAVVPSVNLSNLSTFDKFIRPKVVTDRKMKLAYFVGSIDQEDDQRMYHQMHIEEGIRDWEVQYIDVSGGEEAIRTGWLTAINMEVDAILIAQMDSLANKMDLIVQAREAGIGVYAVDSVGLPGVITNFTTPMGVAALELFYQVASDMDWNGNFCISTAYTYMSVLERTLPVYSYLTNGQIFPGLALLDEQSVDFGNVLSPPEQCYQFMQTWNQKYGKDINAVFIGADPDAQVMNESAKSAGRTPDDLVMFTIGGSPNVIEEMRDPSCCVWYNYALPWELYTHNMCELAYQIQVLGYSPGDGNCMISSAGGSTNIKGAIVAKLALPAIGESLHKTFDYYDPNNKDGWFFWEVPGYGIPTY